MIDIKTKIMILFYVYRNESSRKRKVSQAALSASCPFCGLLPSGLLNLI